MNAKFATVITGLAIAGSLLAAAPAFAQSTPQVQGGGWGRGGHMPGVVGTVSGVSGNTVTVASKGFGQNATLQTYSVDASNATVIKSGATSTVSSIATGDTVMVQGGVSGTSVTATMIRDGVPPGMGAAGRFGGPNASSTRPRMNSAAVPQGNGEPVVGGSVTAVNGSALTITNKSNVTYSVDASNAFVTVKGATSTVSSIATGDNVLVQGTVNGTSVTASSVIDQGAAPAASGEANGRGGMFGGFFGAIGGMFHRLFGFF